MQTPARHVTHAQKRLPKQLALDSEIPAPRFRILKRLALCSHNQSRVTPNSGPQGIHNPVGRTDVRLERWIPTQKN